MFLCYGFSDHICASRSCPPTGCPGPRRHLGAQRGARSAAAPLAACESWTPKRSGALSSARGAGRQRSPARQWTARASAAAEGHGRALGDILRGRGGRGGAGCEGGASTEGQEGFYAAEGTGVAGVVQASVATEAVLGSSRSLTCRGAAGERGNGNSAGFEPQPHLQGWCRRAWRRKQ